MGQWKRIYLPMQETWVQSLGREEPLENGNLLQYSFLENPMDRGAWQTTVPGVAKNWTWLSNWVYAHTHMHTHMQTHTHADIHARANTHTHTQRLSCSMACRIFLDQGSNPSPALADRFLITGPPGTLLSFYVNITTPCAVHLNWHLQSLSCVRLFVTPWHL